MTVREIIDILQTQLHAGGDSLDRDVSTACGSDLMSDVMAFVKDEAVLLTGLVTIQTIRTAIVMDMGVVVCVRGKRPGQDMIDLARDNGIVLLSTAHTMFIACGRLYQAGLREGSRETG
jgi:predicted transcriptional regulator